MFLIIMYWIRC